MASDKKTELGIMPPNPRDIRHDDNRSRVAPVLPAPQKPPPNAPPPPKAPEKGK